MRISTISLLRFSLLIAVATITIFGLSSCNFINIGDPAAKTSGYKLFEGRSDGFRISLEYPNSWSRRSIEKYGGLVVVLFMPSNTSSVTISSDLNKSNGGENTNADEVIQRDLSISSTRPDYNILSEINFKLGQVEAKDITYSYRFIFDDQHAPTKSSHIDMINLVRTVIVDYKNRIYKVNLLMDANTYQNVKPGFEHVISTFQFLE